MVMLRYSISFIILISLTLGIPLYSAQSEAPSLPLLVTAVTATQSVSTTRTTVNRSRPGGQAGILTSARGRVVVIDKNTHRLATAISIEDRNEMPISLDELQSFSWRNGLELKITYWIALNEVTQIIVTLSE